MRFSRDRRGQSVVVGTVILFGFLIVALGIYQIQVVPTENANVEFEHSQTVEDDFGDLRNDVLRAGSTGSAGSTQIRLGTRYPPRTFFINPPPVSGSIATEATGAIRVRNATLGDGVHPNAAAFWNTSPGFPTRSLRYDTDYNELRGTPELVYEHSVIAAEFDDAVLLRSGQTAVSEGRISLTALTGSTSESGVQSRNVDVRAVSASDTTVPLEPTGGQITLDLPTAVDNASALATRWNDALPAGATATPNATGETIRIALTNGSDPYRLALSEVSIDDTGDTEPAYVVPVGSESAAVGDTVRVEVRDRYNNPVPDATVAFDGSAFSVNRTTDADGRATFEANETGSLVAQINGSGGPTYESVGFTVSEGGRSGANRTFDVEWDEIDPVQIEEGTSVPLDILVSDGVLDQRIDGAPVDTSFAPRGTVNGPITVSSPSVTDSNGRTTASVGANEALAGDSFNLYASSGDDVDRITVDIIESGSVTRIYPDTSSVNQGSFSNFANMQDEDGTFATFDGQGSNAFDVETTTEAVPSGDYRLELGVGTVGLGGNSNGVEVTVEDGTGTEIGSRTLTESDSNTVVTLNLGTIDPSQDITVRYEGGRNNDDLEIDYQRLVEQP